jgi:hypothetical protein
MGEGVLLGANGIDIVRGGLSSPKESMRLHRVAAVLVAIAVAFGLHAAQGSAGSVRHTAKIAKDENGPFLDDTVSAKLAPGTAKSFYIKVKNTTANATVPVAMSAETANEEGYKQKWFRGDTNITNKVMNDDFAFSLGAGKVRRFRLKLKANDSPPDEYCSITGFEDTDLASTAAVYVRLHGGSCVI